MKKTFFGITCCLLACVAMVGCGKNDKQTEKKSKNTTIGASAAVNHSMANIAYVDMDTLLLKYNLAVDYQEQIMAKQNALAAEEKNQVTAIQRQQELMTRKLKNGQYKSEAEMQQDQKTLENLQINAEKKMGALQEDLQKLLVTSNSAVQDSVVNYINEYNAEKKYTAIFQKGATLYIDPALDITDEVIEGLNARYNKIK